VWAKGGREYGKEGWNVYDFAWAPGLWFGCMVSELNFMSGIESPMVFTDGMAFLGDANLLLGGSKSATAHWWMMKA